MLLYSNVTECCWGIYAAKFSNIDTESTRRALRKREHTRSTTEKRAHEGPSTINRFRHLQLPLTFRSSNRFPAAQRVTTRGLPRAVYLGSISSCRAYAVPAAVATALLLATTAFFRLLLWSQLWTYTYKPSALNTYKQSALNVQTISPKRTNNQP